MRLNPARRDGLSMLEVLVSLAIFLMALVALTHLVNTSSNLAAEGHVKARAAQLCRSKLSEFISGALPLESQPDSSFEDDTDYRWGAEITPGAATGLFNVTVTVTHRPDDPYPVKIALSRMILDSKYVGSTQDVPATPDESAAESSTTPATDSTGSGSSGAAPASGGGAAASSGGAKSGGAASAPSNSGGAKSGGGATMGSGGASSGAASGGAKSSGAGAGSGSGAKGK